MIAAERHATVGGLIITARDVYEDGTAVAGADWIVVIADLDD